MLHEQAGETLLSIGNASGLNEHILYLDTAGMSSRGPFQCFFPVLGMCLQLALTPVVHLGCLVSPQLAASRVSYETSTASPDCEAGKQVSLRMCVKCRGSDPDHSVSCLGSSGKQYLLSCWSLSHLMGDGILHLISFQWLSQAIDVFQW